MTLEGMRALQAPGCSADKSFFGSAVGFRLRHGSEIIKTQVNHDKIYSVPSKGSPSLGFQGSKDGGHAPAFHSGFLIQFCNVFQCINEACKDDHPLFLVDNIPPSELHIGTHLVAVGEEFVGVLCFELEVMRIGARSKPDFFELRVMLPFASIALLLILLVEKLAVVHNLTDWRIGIWCNFYEIHGLLSSHIQGFLQLVHAMLTSRINYADYVCLNGVVNTCLYTFCDDVMSLCFEERQPKAFTLVVGPNGFEPSTSTMST